MQVRNAFLCGGRDVLREGRTDLADLATERPDVVAELKTEYAYWAERVGAVDWRELRESVGGAVASHSLEAASPASGGGCCLRGRRWSGPSPYRACRNS